MDVFKQGDLLGMEAAYNIVNPYGITLMEWAPTYPIDNLERLKEQYAVWEAVCKDHQDEMNFHNWLTEQYMVQFRTEEPEHWLEHDVEAWVEEQKEMLVSYPTLTEDTTTPTKDTTKDPHQYILEQNMVPRRICQVEQGPPGIMRIQDEITAWTKYMEGRCPHVTLRQVTIRQESQTTCVVLQWHLVTGSTCNLCEHLKKKPWFCEVCLVPNDDYRNECRACETPRVLPNQVYLQPQDSSFHPEYLTCSAKSDRTLATIRRIHSVTEHTNADRLCLLRIATLYDPEQDSGWQIVANKQDHQYHMGDLVVYIEVDAILPTNREYFAFMRTYKGRLKTRKIRGEISQGLVFPLEVLGLTELKEGTDVTSLLELEKYIPSAERNSYMVHAGMYVPFPEDVAVKTAEPRIQNCSPLRWGSLQSRVIITEKMHGTSSTYIFDHVGDLKSVCSRNYVRPVDTSEYWRIVQKYQLDQKQDVLKPYGSLVIQGEICGPNINGNMYKLKELEFFVFTMTDSSKHRLPYDRMCHIAEQLGLRTVPVIDKEVDLTGIKPVDILSLYAEGKSLLQPKALREGVVVRSLENPHFSFKALNNTLLAKQK